MHSISLKKNLRKTSKKKKLLGVKKKPEKKPNPTSICLKRILVKKAKSIADRNHLVQTQKNAKIMRKRSKKMQNKI